MVYRAGIIVNYNGWLIDKIRWDEANGYKLVEYDIFNTMFSIRTCIFNLIVHIEGGICKQIS